mmetsp:Transcript_63490/g.176601  ORF Transcript_63490/g.176601 Transcript_63490/m.176601 type:complete len:284 (+) Transcript_63490:1474-2325(+)
MSPEQAFSKCSRSPMPVAPAPRCQCRGPCPPMEIRICSSSSSSRKSSSRGCNRICGRSHKRSRSRSNSSRSNSSPSTNIRTSSILSRGRRSRRSRWRSSRGSPCSESSLGPQGLGRRLAIARLLRHLRQGRRRRLRLWGRHQRKHMGRRAAAEYATCPGENAPGLLRCYVGPRPASPTAAAAALRWRPMHRRGRLRLSTAGRMVAQARAGRYRQALGASAALAAICPKRQTTMAMVATTTPSIRRTGQAMASRRRRRPPRRSCKGWRRHTAATVCRIRHRSVP